jgi:hypothetical protein
MTYTQPNKRAYAVLHELDNRFFEAALNEDIRCEFEMGIVMSANMDWLCIFCGM